MGQKSAQKPLVLWALFTALGAKTTKPGNGRIGPNGDFEGQVRQLVERCRQGHGCGFESRPASHV